MALYISEYATAPILSGAQLLIAGEPSTRSQMLEVGDKSQASEPFGPSTKYIRVFTDEDCALKFGPNPEATTADARMAGNTTELFAVQAGHRVAALGAGRGWPHSAPTSDR